MAMAYINQSRFSCRSIVQDTALNPPVLKRGLPWCVRAQQLYKYQLGLLVTQQ